jgi:hypothetical protein
MGQINNDQDCCIRFMINPKGWWLQKESKTRTDKESFVAPMKTTLEFKDGVLQMVTKSASQTIVETKKKVASVFPPVVAANPTKTNVRKGTLTSGHCQNGILEFMTILIPRHAVDDSPSIVTPPKQVDEVTTKQVMNVPILDKM